jgi:hypothetical protein
LPGRASGSIPGSSTEYSLVIALNLPKTAFTSMGTVGSGIGPSFAQRETKCEFTAGRLESRPWPGKLRQVASRGCVRMATSRRPNRRKCQTFFIHVAGKSLIPNGDQAPGADETAVKYQAHCVTEMIPNRTELNAKPPP